MSVHHFAIDPKIFKTSVISGFKNFTSFLDRLYTKKTAIFFHSSQKMLIAA